jgi:histidinol-phosphate aminotransferase
MSTLKPRPGIQDIAPYVGGKDTIEGFDKPTKLSSNEGALGPSPKAMEAYRKAAAELHRYPEGGSTDLRAAIGRHYGLDPARIICGAGSDELINLLVRAYLGPGEELLYSAHGFLMYAINAKAVGAVAVTAPEKDLRGDIDALLAKVTPKTKVVCIANPNNPTGSYLTREEMKKLHEGLPKDVLLIIDAAYAEYVSRNDYSAGVELVDGADNVVMTRTFSKIYGLGGLRLGWMYASPAITDTINRLRQPFNVNLAAQAAGIAALEDVAHTDAQRTNNDIWLPWFTKELTALGLHVYPSVGNFVLVKFPKEAGKNAEAANAAMMKAGIIPRMMGAYGLGDCLRITIGNEAEMRAARAALAKFVGQA